MRRLSRTAWLAKTTACKRGAQDGDCCEEALAVNFGCVTTDLAYRAEQLRGIVAACELLTATS